MQSDTLTTVDGTTMKMLVDRIRQERRRCGRIQMRRGNRAGIREMKTNRRWEKHNPLAVIILAAFFHRFSYHYGALSQKAVRQDGLFFYKGDLNSEGTWKGPG